MINFNKFEYDTKKYLFKDLIIDLYGVSDLNKLHSLRSELLPKEKLNFNNEASTNFHKMFYKKLNDNWLDFINSYEKFIKNEISKIISKPFFVATASNGEGKSFIKALKRENNKMPIWTYCN